MSIHLHRDLEALEQNLLAQSSVVEQMILRASQALRELRTDLIERLLDDEESVNTREVALEEECLKLLALHQPVAIDLRRIATVLKINGDLERIADLAVNIGGVLSESSSLKTLRGSFASADWEPPDAASIRLAPGESVTFAVVDVPASDALDRPRDATGRLCPSNTQSNQ